MNSFVLCDGGDGGGGERETLWQQSCKSYQSDLWPQIRVYSSECCRMSNEIRKMNKKIGLPQGWPGVFKVQVVRRLHL